MILEQITIISVNSVNRLIFGMETASVFFEVRILFIGFNGTFFAFFK
jgi:hypothetical protein